MINYYDSYSSCDWVLITCHQCGRTKKISICARQTLNPFNLDSKGNVKTVDIIKAENDARLPILANEAVSKGYLCRVCSKKNSLPKENIDISTAKELLAKLDLLNIELFQLSKTCIDKYKCIKKQAYEICAELSKAKIKITKSDFKSTYKLKNTLVDKEYSFGEFVNHITLPNNFYRILDNNDGDIHMHFKQYGWDNYLKKEDFKFI
jgi:hypothetical protein